MASLNPPEKQNTEQSKAHARSESEKPISMHEDIPVWYDCCSCEAEPYWLEAMEQIEDGKHKKCSDK